MKKFLSLVLALVMTMSLVTVSAGAAFDDADDINYAEAVDVMQAVKVIGGYPDGTFKPTNTLTRGAAAKIICNMILGPTTAEALVATTAPYSDVAADSTFAGYIAYCKNQGIISGYADGTFKPGASLTGYAFMKMLLCALGFDQKIEGYVGENWSIAVAKQVQNFDLASGNKNFNGTKPVTREEACLYALNTLKARPVTYADKGTSITINGAEIVTGASTWSYKNGNEDYLYMNELFGDDLVMEASSSDAFNRKATTWTYDGDEVGTYAATPKFVFTTAQDDDDIVATLKSYTINTYKVNDDVTAHATFTKGAVTFTNGYTIADDLAAATSNGKLVEIYTSKNTITDIVAITYGVAEVSAVTTNKDGDVKYTLKGVGSYTIFADEDKDAEIVNASDVKKGDIVTYTTDKNGVKYTYPTETITGVVTRMKAGDYVTVDGTKYPLATGVSAPVQKDAQELVIDQYGVVVKADDVKQESDVVYVAYSWSEKGAYNKTIYMAQIVDQKGNVVEKEIADVSSTISNGLYSYYVTSKDTAALTPADADEGIVFAGKTFDTTAKRLTNNNTNYYYFTSDVTFVNVEKSGADLKVSASTGLQKVVSKDVYAVVDDADIVTVFVPAAAEASVNKDDVLFLAKDEVVAKQADKKGDSGDAYELYQDAEPIEVLIKSGFAGVGFYTYSIDSSTGRYALTKVDANVGYSCSYDAQSLTILAKKYVELEPGFVTSLAKDCDIYDLTDNGLTDLASIVEFVENNEDAAFELHAIYDAKEDEVTCIYIIEQA